MKRCGNPSNRPGAAGDWTMVARGASVRKGAVPGRPRPPDWIPRFGMGSWRSCGSGYLFGEHLTEHSERFGQSIGGELAEAANQPGTIDGADLVEDDMSVLAGESTGEAKGILVASRRQRSHDEGPQMGSSMVKLWERWLYGCYSYEI